MTLKPRARRWLLALSAAAVILAIAGWWIDRQLEPNRLTATVLRQVGQSLQLQLSFEGEPEYALKPEPRLLVPNLSVSGSDGKVFLSARQLEISLPWSTITGGAPVITRIQLLAPVLDLPGLRRWLATRPDEPFELPTLSQGLRVTDGTVRDESWSLRALSLELPRLQQDEPAAIATAGSFHQGKTVLSFDATLDLAKAGLESDYSLQGSAALQQQPEPLSFRLGMAGHYRAAEGDFTLDAKTLKLDGSAPLPTLSGKASLQLADTTRLTLDAVLAEWPKSWPTLPEALAADMKNLPVQLSYQGKPDFSDPLSVRAARGETRLEASLLLPDLQRWLAADDASPLPPLDGTLSLPSIAFDGVELQGVELEISDDAPAEPAPAAATP